MTWKILRGMKLFGEPDAAAEPGDAAIPPSADEALGGSWAELTRLPWSPPPIDAPGHPWAQEEGDVDEPSSVWEAVDAPAASLRVGWEEAADPGPPPAPGDDDAADDYARRFAVARFARRVLEGDPHAWVEALVSYRDRIRLPVAVRSTVRAEDDGSLRIAVELPFPDTAARRGATRAERMARHDELCSGVLLAFACDTFRVLPREADSVYVLGYRRENDPATGHPRFAILMRLATDRGSMEAIDLSRATPSAAFEHLGGAVQKVRGELVALAHETDAERLI